MEMIEIRNHYDVYDVVFFETRNMIPLDVQDGVHIIYRSDGYDPIRNILETL